MSQINLNNNKLREYIRDFLSENNYQEPFSTLLEEVFLREQYVLDLSPQELYEDLVNFKNSVKSISFGEVENPNWIGVAEPNKKTITFNYNYWQDVCKNFPAEQYYKKFFESFAHECLHGMQNNGFQNRAGGYNRIIENREHAIYEICTQGIAAKMTYNRSRSEYRSNEVLTGDGYADEVFAVSLIAAAFGVTEKDVLKYGVREREKFVEVLNKNIGDINTTKKLLFNIENQLEYIHSVSYPDADQIQYINLTPEQKQIGTTIALKNLVQISQEVLINRIKNVPLDFNPKIALQFKYDQKKIEDVLSQEFMNYRGNFSQNYRDFITILENTGNQQYINESINVFCKIATDKTGVYKNLAPYLIDAVRRGDFEYCLRAGIKSINNKNTYTIMNTAYAFNDEKGKEDYNNFKEWDNTNIYEAMSNTNKKINTNSKRKISLKDWKDLYTPEGFEKINALRYMLYQNNEKYGISSKDILLDFIEGMGDAWNTKITRTNDARKYFTSKFNSDSDRVFLVKYLATKYVESAFNEDGTIKLQDSKKATEIQSYMIDSYKAYGKEDLVTIISIMLLNDGYNGFYGANNALNLAATSKKELFDIISQPAINELLNKRQVTSEKDEVLKSTIISIEKRYPGTSAWRLANVIENYSKTNMVITNAIPTGYRTMFYQTFKPQSGIESKGMEDIVGLLCDEYSENYRNTNNVNCQNYANNLYFNDIIEKYGEDFFREAMICGMVRNDYFPLQNLGYGPYISQTTIYDMMETLAKPYIEKTKIIENIKYSSISNINTIGSENLGNVAKKQTLTGFKGFLNKLFVNEKSQYIMRR